ncbi:DCL family protein [Aquirufa aurantiipilula]
MGKRQAIEIGENIYPTKKEALGFYKEILNSYKPGDELSNEDFELVYNLLKNHPQADEKIGKGIFKLTVERDEYSTQCFHIIRNDNSKENFSYIKCINGNPNNFTQFSKACRKTVEGDLKDVKQLYFKEHSKNGKIKCQESSEYISFDETHVDHRQPNTFSVIVDRFIELYSIDLSNVQYDKNENYGHQFVDTELAENFRQYHFEKATLRLIKKNRNLARSFQGRVNKQKKDITIKK